MKSILSALLLLFVLIPTSLLANEMHAHATPRQFTAKFISDSTTVGEDKEVWLGLDINLAPGWHTYWKLPGETGEPPSIGWSKSKNLESAELFFPAPKRIRTPLSDVIGYENRVTFPIKVTLKKAKKALKAKACITLLVCNQICVPNVFNIDFHLHEGATASSADAPYFSKLLASIPTPNEKHGLNITKTERTINGLALTVKSETPFKNLDLFVDNPKSIIFERPQFKYNQSHNEVRITADFPGLEDNDLDMNTLPITVTLVDGERMLEEVIPNLDVQQDSHSFAAILLLALLGGLILNLMPCVLPVLSLKIMAALKLHNHGKRAIRASFLATTAGIICSFMVLAVVTIGLKYTGHILGWGVQFQQPLFLLFMIVILTLFAANMWGLFRINLPHWAMDKIGKNNASDLAGNFGTGMFATLLATPCTAPFLGTAVGFALASGTKEIVSIFFMLGVGMSLPFLLVAIIPSIARLFPKPGAWMVTVSRLLGFGLAGTAIWLLFVLKAQVGQTVTTMVEVALLTILVLIFFRSKNVLKRLFTPAVVIILIAAFSFVAISTEPNNELQQSSQWQLFDESRIETAINNGKVVFVDITADWCLNCKFNKKFIMTQDSVRDKLFNNDNVLAMQGDWTSPDPILTNFLHKHGRYGIPFNAIFGPRAPNGILLPEILTPSAIYEAIEKAK